MFLTNCVLMLNWIVWNRTDYLYKHGFDVKYQRRLICHKTQPTNQPWLREGAAEVCEFFYHLQSLSLDGDVGLDVWFSWRWLVHHFSLFFVLMGRQKLSQASDNLSTLFWILALVVAFSVQPSANRSSLTLVFAWSLLSLKIEPSVRYRMSIPISEPQNASNRITENMMLKKVQVRTHSCLTPFVTGKATELFPLSYNLACIPSWNYLTMV